MAAAAGAKIKVANPVVDLDGDEMTRWVLCAAFPAAACSAQCGRIKVANPAVEHLERR